MRLLTELMNRMRLTSPTWKELEAARRRVRTGGALPPPHHTAQATRKDEPK